MYSHLLSQNMSHLKKLILVEKCQYIERGEKIYLLKKLKNL
jgi:hypothetical protein